MSEVPFHIRITTTGPVGYGITNQNMRLRALSKPLYDKIFLVWHPDFDYLKEWTYFKPTFNCVSGKTSMLVRKLTETD